MSLDCTTERGRAFIAHQATAVARFAKHCKCDAAETGSADRADIDALFHRNGKLVAIAEVKARNMSRDELRQRGSYLISLNKLTKGAEASRSMCVPFFVLVLLLTDSALCWWKITDEAGAFTMPFDVRLTKTKETCNGGEIIRPNAYIPEELSATIYDHPQT